MESEIRELIGMIRSNRNDYKVTEDQYLFAKDIWTLFDDCPLTIREVEILLNNEL